MRSVACMAWPAGAALQGCTHIRATLSNGSVKQSSLNHDEQDLIQVRQHSAELWPSLQQRQQQQLKQQQLQKLGLQNPNSADLLSLVSTPGGSAAEACY